MASPSNSTVSASGSGSTPTSTSTITLATYVSTPTPATSAKRPYPLSASQADKALRGAGTTESPFGRGSVNIPTPNDEQEGGRSRIPVTPAVLRAIFASSRTPGEERSLSRVAFFRFSGFLLSCLAISLVANRARGIRSGAALLGVGV